VLGVLLVPLVLASGLSGVPVRGGAGDRHWKPRTVGQLDAAQHLAAGTLTLDLTGVSFGREPTIVHADIGMGELDVVLPPDVPLDVRARVGAGQAMLLEHRDGGVDVDTELHAGGSPQLGHLILNLRAVLGQVRVWRAAGPTQGA
jgi:Cell wall-active antibiotics response 4TMS YvqF